MHKLILVEDDKKLAQLTKKFLEMNGFDVTVFSSGYEATQAVLDSHPDILILDISLPDLDGFKVLLRVREEFAGPILMLTARDSDFDEVRGLEYGADDYLRKPTEPHVLLARVNALLRRETRKNKASDTLKLGELVMNKSDRHTFFKGEVVTLTSDEFDILWLLASNAGEVMSRDQICLEVMGRQAGALDRSIDMKISRLRKKFGDDLESAARLKTIRRKGYLCSKSGWN